MNIKQIPTNRRDFLIASAGLALSTLVARADDRIAKTNEDDSERMFEDGSGLGGVSVSVHPPGGGHLAEDSKVTVTDAAGIETVLSRAKGGDVYLKYLPAGHYRVCVEATGFSASCIDVDTAKSEILMLPVYLGKEGWPSVKIGGVRMPFEPNFDEIVLVFARPIWRTLDYETYVKLIASLGGIFDPQGHPDKNWFVACKGTVLRFKTKNGAPIFSKDANDPDSTELAGIFNRTIRETFPPAQFGEIRVGVPIRNKNGLVRVLDNRFLVKLGHGPTVENIKQIQETYGATIQETPALKNVRVLKFNNQFNYLRNLVAIDKLFKEGVITQAEPDLIFELRYHAPPALEPWYFCQRYLQIQKIDSAWGLQGSSQFGNPNVTITMIDSGVNRLQLANGGHPDLAPGQITCVDLLEISPANKLRCEYVPYDAHGMSVYGVIAAKYNGVGVAGIAPDATQVAIRTHDPETTESYATMLLWAGGLATSPVDINNNAISGVPAITPASIINCSHGIEDIPLPDEIRNAFRSLAVDGRAGKGVIVVYSAGQNDGTDPLYGADVQGVQAASLSPRPIIVSNTSLISCGCYKEVHDPGSNFGLRIDLCASGGLQDTTSYVGVAFSGESPSLLHNNLLDTNLPVCSFAPSAKDGITRFGRTSAAAAMVSGVVGLMLSQRDLSLSKVKQILRKTADKIDSECSPSGTCTGTCCDFLSCNSTVGYWRGWSSWAGWWATSSSPNGLPKGLGTRSNWYGWGRLDAYSALSVTLSEPP